MDEIFNVNGQVEDPKLPKDKDMIAVKIKRLNQEAIMPVKGSDGAAAFDLKLPFTTKIRYGNQVIPTGLAAEMPPFIRMDCRSRSGYASKGLIVADENGERVRIKADVELGLIDSDYRGEIGIILKVKDWRVKWLFWKRYYVLESQALAQITFTKVPNVVLYENGTLTETLRGANGFGKHNGE